MPDTFQSIAVILLFLLPGFLMYKVFLEKGAYVSISDTRLVLTAIYFSAINHVLLSYFTLPIFRYYEAGTLFSKHVWGFIAWFIGTILIFPIFLGWLLGWLSKKEWVDNLLSHIGLSFTERCPQAWDLLFQEKQGYWLIIELNDGGKMAGKYGENSAASLSPSAKDIYLEEVYDIDKNENFTNKLVGTKGLWIDGAQIKAIKFFE